MAIVDEAKLGYLDFLSREDRVRHHRYVEEMKQYDMMRSGDINAISESAKLWDSGLYGHLSDDPLKMRNTVSSPPSPWPHASPSKVAWMRKTPTTLPTCTFRILTIARPRKTCADCIPT